MSALKKSALLGLSVSAIVLSGCLSGGSSSSSTPAPPPTATPPSEPVRAQQQRINDNFFVVNETQVNNFTALNAAVPAYANTSRWSGIHNGAGYRIEVPENWNGTLVMWAHGFRGEGSALTVDNPPMRQYLLDNGFAWGASSYSTNFYDVRAGVEDTNALALAFNQIASANGRELPAPSKYYISGVSMGGHIAGAAIEKETQDTANNFVPYNAAAPMCGVMGDTKLFDYFTAYALALYELADVGATSFPVSQADAAEKVAVARQRLWVDYDANKSNLTTQGQPLFNIVQNLTGGPRPIYDLAFGGFQNLLQGFAGADGTVTGILNESVVDTRGLTYRFQSQPGQPLTYFERVFNENIIEAVPAPGANALRADGLRWIPKVNGELYAAIPVVTVHTLGDLFVPISMQQIYRQRMEANGFGDQLVQRAVRAPGHCDFSIAEFTETFDAMVQWEVTGNKPAGDDLLNASLVATPSFGCQFTRNGFPQATTRAVMPACPVAE